MSESNGNGGVVYLGINVWWNFTASRVDMDEVGAVLMANGFDPEKYMARPSRRAVVSRAAYSFQNRRTNNDRRLVEGVANRDNEIVWGILNEGVAGEDEVEYKQSTTVVMHKGTGRVRVEGDLVNEFEAELAEFEKVYTDDDFRSFVRQLIHECHGRAKRPTGGLYFVPKYNVERIRAGAEVIKTLGVGKVSFERLLDGDEERENVWESVSESVLAEIDRTLARADRVEKRVSSLKEHDDKISELGELVEVYTKIVGDQADQQDIVDRLAQATDQIAAKITTLKAKVGPTAASGEKRNPGSRTVAWVKKVLDDMGNPPMTADQLSTDGQGLGYYTTKAANPGRSISDALNKAIKAGNSEIERLNGGRYRLVQTTT